MMTEEERAELAAVRQRVEELERAAKPPEPFKPGPPPNPNWLLDRASMPSSAMREMTNAIPDKMVREIVNGGLSPQTLAPLAGGNVRPTVAQQNTSGWRSPAPLSNPPGVAQADKLMDVQDQRDRAELIASEAKRRLAKPDAA